MASARNGFPKIVDLFRPAITSLDPAAQPIRDRSFKDLVRKLDEELVPRVEKVVRLTPTITEVILHAPLQARKFEPGQFYRLQDFDSQSTRVKGIKLAMEGVALTGAWVDKEKGLLSLIILEMGGSSNLCALLRPGQRVVCMGPTGAPTEIPHGENVVLCGGGLGNAVLFSIAKALQAAGSKVLYFAGYKNGIDLFKGEEIEAATDQVIWSTDAGLPIEARRPQDRHFRGNIVQAMIAYARGELGRQIFPLHAARRIIAIGSDRMMAAVKMARHDPHLLASHLGDHVAIGSINSPMQCMMKEVCAQCLQRHIDPKTGEEYFVFSCFNQDQRLDEVDFHHLNLRLRQNGVLEKPSAATIALLLDSTAVPRV
jgi:NAD(P)H-flavin reductase